jgi:hypothetical protein
MRRLNVRAPRNAGLLALALGAVALLALSGVAAAKDHGSGHGHGRHHHHHHPVSLQETGTISSFDATTGKLTIALRGGESVTGTVTEDTRIRCEGGEEEGEDRREHGGESGQGKEPGDDDGQSGEPGDDDGSDSAGSGPAGESGSAAGEPAPSEASCGVESLVPGAVVGGAELRLEGGIVAFTEIDLGLGS